MKKALISSILVSLSFATAACNKQGEAESSDDVADDMEDAAEDVEDATEEAAEETEDEFDGNPATD